MNSKLEYFFKENNKIAVAFSGGVDSSYLLWAAKRCGADVRAYCVCSEFQPAFEKEDAENIAEYLGAPTVMLNVSVLDSAEITGNPSNRCYYCKKKIFSHIKAAAEKDGYTVIADGTNADDDVSDRPGMKAVEEFGVLSPLRQCGITKAEIRSGAHKAGLFVWSKPSYSCLATRIAANVPITADLLQKVSTSESFLFKMGYRDFRVRTDGSEALIQVTEDQHSKAAAELQYIEGFFRHIYSNTKLDEKTRKGK